MKKIIITISTIILLSSCGYNSNDNEKIINSSKIEKKLESSNLGGGNGVPKEQKLSR